MNLSLLPALCALALAGCAAVKYTPTAYDSPKPAGPDQSCLTGKLDYRNECLALVRAKDVWSDSGVQVTKGEVYRVTVPPGQSWLDAGRVNVPPQGEPGSPMMNLASKYKRHDTDWFSLIAAVAGAGTGFDREERDWVDVGRMARTGCTSVTFEAQADGALAFYPNDAKGQPELDRNQYYENNQGQAWVQVKLLTQEEAAAAKNNAPFAPCHRRLPPNDKELHFVPLAAVPMASLHEITSSRHLQYLSCDYRSQDLARGASSMFLHSTDHLDMAPRAFAYAAMANNVYRSPDDKPVFRLPGWTLTERKESASGLVLEVLERRDAGRLAEVVVAYKGTDFEEKNDWRANLSINREPVQYEEAQGHFEGLLNKPAYAGVPITVTGHSLGGGIALNVSLRHSTQARPIRAFVFNTSPRGFYTPIDFDVRAERVLIDERADFLWAGRLPWARKLGRLNATKLTYNFLDFNYFTGKNIEEHSIYLLTRGLLLMAIHRDSDYARKVFAANVTMEHAKALLPTLSRYKADTQFDLDYCAAIIEGREPPRH